MKSQLLFTSLVITSAVAPFVLCQSPIRSDATDELAKPATWTNPSQDSVGQTLRQLLDNEMIPPATQTAAWKVWQSSDEDLLTRTVVTLSVINPQVDEIRRQCLIGIPTTADATWLNDAKTPEFIRAQARLYLGRFFARQKLYDEALEMLGEMTPDQVVDPAGLLFYRGVAEYVLLRKKQGLKSFETLLENEPLIPARFVSLAKLMASDLQPLEADSLDEISRMMADVRRRLDLGRAGTVVRKEEDDVIAKLDKLIEEAEKQQQQQQQQSSGQGNSQSSNPAQDSQALGGKGQGDIDQKRIGNKSGWGNLPPKDREKALQQISKDLPAHYRQVIEEYFRRLANESDQ